MAAVKVHVREPYRDVDRGYELTLCGLPIKFPGGRRTSRYKLTERNASGELCQKCQRMKRRRHIGERMLNT